MSYFLATDANLGDLYDSDKSRKALNIGPMETQNANDVYIHNANIFTSNLQFLFDDLLHIRQYISYIKCIDNKGTSVWFPNDSWISDEYIHVSNFFKDIDLINHTQIKKTSTSGNFNDLINTPKTQDVFDNLDEIPPLLLASSNLLDIQNINKNSLQKSLGIGNISFENNDTLLLTGISCDKFFFPDYSALHGSLLTSEDDNILIDGLQTNKTKWKHPFYNDDGSVKDELKLGNSYKNTSTTNTVTAKTLKDMYDDTLFRINKRHSKFNKDRIKNTLSNYAENGIFLQTSNFLGEPELNDALSRRNIGLGTSSSQNSSNVSIISLSVDNNITLLDTSNVDDFLHLMFKCTDSNGAFQLSNLKSATENEFGFVKYIFDFYNSNNPENGIITWKLLQKAQNNIIRDLNIFQRSGFLYNFNQFSNDIGLIIDKDMSQLQSKTSNDLLLIYENLNLSQVSYTGDYIQLDNHAKSIETFYNDIELLNKFENCINMHQFAYSNALNLGCGNTAIQDFNNVELVNGNGSFNIIETDNLFVYPNEHKINDKWLFINVNSEMIYNDLPFASENEYGVVKKISDYNTVSDSAVISIDSLKHMYNIINDKIDELDREIYEYITSNVSSPV